MLKKCAQYLFWIIILVFIQTLTIAAQENNSSIKKGGDTIKTDLITKLKKLGDAEINRSIIKYKETKDAIKQEQLLEEIKDIMLKSKSYIKQLSNTATINQELLKINKWHNIAEDGIFSNKGTSNTYRNLATTSKLLLELLNRVKSRKKQIDKQEKDLVNFRFKIDSLSSDSILYTFSSDTLTTKEYIKKMMVIVYQIGPVDTALKKSITNVRLMQYKIDLLANQLVFKLEEIDNYQKELSSASFMREFNNLGGEVVYARPVNQILHFSFLKTKLILEFYIANNFGKIILLLLTIVFATIFLTSLKKLLVHEKLLNDDFNGQLAFRYPLFSALVIILSVFQFVFTDPPFVLSAIFWLISSVSLAFIFNKFIDRYWLTFWISIIILFILAALGNLILQASRIERYYMILLNMLGILVGTIVLIKGLKHQLKEKLIIYFIGILVVLELTSIFANFFGRYNLSKSLLISGYTSLVVGVLFLWAVRLANECLAIATRVYTKQERKLFYINFELVGKQIPKSFYLLLIIAWCILLGKNFYAFNTIVDPLKNFFSVERTIGSYTFTVYNLLVFFIIMACAVILSKIVSFFASERPHDHVLHNERKAGLGSWILLIRVIIISSGVLLALAAAGFPMEKITLIVGALGVGIGFGLQTIVNNLVSGLIIAFEKPVNVGDVVEVVGQAGTVKSIGFRSSIISKWDGADVVIPNGDLLNSHLVNWTLAGNKKQISIILNVAYGTNLQKVKAILTELLESEDRIIKTPNHAIVFQDFKADGIEVKILFWVRDLKDSGTVKSDLIVAIEIAFKNNEIIIPLPQHTVHLHDETANKILVPKLKKTNK